MDYSVLYRTGYNRLQHNEAATETEFVKVRKDLKGFVIGKDGSSIKEIMKSSGALVTSPRRNDDGFFVRGDAGQRECAKRLILEKAVSAVCNNNKYYGLRVIQSLLFVKGFAGMNRESFNCAVKASISAIWSHKINTAKFLKL